jgi:hypothetical protein
MYYLFGAAAFASDAVSEATTPQSGSVAELIGEADLERLSDVCADECSSDLIVVAMRRALRAGSRGGGKTG